MGKNDLYIFVGLRDSPKKKKASYMSSVRFLNQSPTLQMFKHINFLF